MIWLIILWPCFHTSLFTFQSVARPSEIDEVKELQKVKYLTSLRWFYEFVYVDTQRQMWWHFCNINSLTQQDPWKYPMLTVQWPAGAQNYTQHRSNFLSEGNNEMNSPPPVSTWSHYFSFLRSLSKTALLLLNSNLQVTKLIFSFSPWPHFSFSQETFYFYPSFPREPVQE